MSLGRFLTQMFESGRVTVAAPDERWEEDDAELHDTLGGYAAILRRSQPAGLPQLDLEAATYGARTLYRACQLLAYRDLDERCVTEWIDIPPLRANPAEHWSVDLVLHLLPDVVRLARAAASEDPLVHRLLQLGRRWPLSSVGIAGLGEVDIEPLRTHAALWLVYLDRVHAQADAARLEDERVRNSFDALWGAYPELAGALRSSRPSPNSQGHLVR